MKEGRPLTDDFSELNELNKFCSGPRDFIFEWRQGQYWLHSDLPKEKPIGIEIDQELLRHEEFFKRSGLQKELLARAIGIKGSYRPKVLDLSAGMLGDAILMLSFGCEVWAVERHPIMQFLIKSALQNASHPKIHQFHFLASDALGVLSGECSFDVIYFDPMFEDANRKTSPHKKMRIFRSVVGQDTDACVVLEKALEKKVKRVVVKRPRLSVPLGGKPSIGHTGKSTRYDVYFSV